MGSAVRTVKRDPDWGAYASVPPPPTAPSLEEPAPPEPSPVIAEEEVAAAMEPQAGHEFDAELDATELDERDRPTTSWSARGRRLSRSGIVIRSRRMCYPGRRILLAVHLIDSEPVPLFGQVRSCEYEGEGLYLLGLDFLPVPDKAEVRDWLRERGP